MTKGDGKVTFHNSKTREEYSTSVLYEVDPSGERQEFPIRLDDADMGVYS